MHPQPADRLGGRWIVGALALAMWLVLVAPTAPASAAPAITPGTDLSAVGGTTLEGLETAHQVRTATQLGIGRGQGNLLGLPVDADAVRAGWGASPLGS